MSCNCDYYNKNSAVELTTLRNKCMVVVKIQMRAYDQDWIIINIISCF
jgi:hypothetical protein